MTRSGVRYAVRVVVCGVLAALAAAGLAGCAGEETGPATLDGTRGGSSAGPSPPFPHRLQTTAAFDEAQVAGAAAVNGYGAPYTTGPDDTFSVDDIAATDGRSAPRDGGRGDVLRALEAAASYALEGDALTSTSRTAAKHSSSRRCDGDRAGAPRVT